MLAQPRRWKMVVVTLLALYPTSLLIGLLVGPPLAHLPLVVRAFLQALVVPLMTYLIMPGATRAFRQWLRSWITSQALGPATRFFKEGFPPCAAA